MGILDLPGPQFLALFVGLLVAGVAGTLVLQARLRAPDGDPPLRDMKALSPVEIAYLADGEPQAARAAIASLVQRQLIAVDPDKHTFRAATRRPVELDAVEKSIYDGFGGLERDFASIRLALSRSLAPVRASLLQRRFLVDSRSHTRARMLPLMLLGLVLVLGILKLGVGVSRGRPVTALVVLLLVTAVLMIGLAATVRERSRLGDRALDSLKVRNAALRETATANPARLSPQDFAVAVALFGGTVLTTPSHADLGRALQAQDRTSAQSASGCSSCGGSGCGGGDGGGCGGCGGGCGG